MAKNYMTDVAKLLGVELEEEFKIKTHGKTLYKLTERGLKCLTTLNGWEENYIFVLLLCGKLEIEKLPRKPKQGDKYYFVFWVKNSGGWVISVSCEKYDECFAGDTLRVDVGNCFRTREEAEAAKYEVFKRLTDKDWHETYGKEGGNNATD